MSGYCPLLQEVCQEETWGYAEGSVFRHKPQLTTEHQVGTRAPGAGVGPGGGAICAASSWKLWRYHFSVRPRTLCRVCPGQGRVSFHFCELRQANSKPSVCQPLRLPQMLPHGPSTQDSKQLLSHHLLPMPHPEALWLQKSLGVPAALHRLTTQRFLTS